MQFGIKLRTINRVLRWSGWRLYVGLDDGFIADTTQPPKTQIGLIWYGWGFIKELSEDLADND